MADYNPLLSYPRSKNRLLVIDWASVGYHQWHSMLSKHNAGVYDIDTSEKELKVWKTLVAAKIMKYIRLFNPMDVVIALEGDGKIWRKKYYAEYYQENTEIFYDKSGYYVRFDNFFYHVKKTPSGVTIDKLDPTKPVPNLTKIDYEKLSPEAKQVMEDVIPSYKGTRKLLPWKHLTPKAVWTKVRDEFAFQLGEIIRAKNIRDFESEGDDIIYVAVRYYEPKYESIVLVSGDGDCTQLLNQKNLIIYNNNKDNLVTCHDPNRFLNVKVLSGDKSDNINGMALPGKKVQLGETGADNLFESVGGNCYAAAKSGGWEKQYLRNRKLIDMSFIPLEIETRVKNLLDVPRPEIAPHEKIFRLDITEKIMKELTSMKELGYYTLHDYAEVEKNPNLFKESLVSKSFYDAPEPTTPMFGVGSMMSR